MQSPARLQRSLADLTNQIERDKGLVADAEKKGRELAARLNALAKVGGGGCISPAVKIQ